MIPLAAHWSKIRQRKLYVATPLYAGQMHFGFHDSMMQLLALCMKQGVHLGTKCVGSDSLVPRARNRLCAYFLDSGYTDLLFVDADIGFSAEHALSLLAFDEPVIGGIYSRKQIDWLRIRRAARAGVAAELLPTFGTTPCLNWKGPVMDSNGNSSLRLDSLYPVNQIGTGFLRIRREVLVGMIHKFGERIAFDYASDEAQFSGHVGYDFFPSGIDTRYPLGSGQRQYLSEDWFACERAQECGFSIHAAPWIRLTHHGAYDYVNDFSAMDRPPLEDSPTAPQADNTLPPPTLIVSRRDG